MYTYYRGHRDKVVSIQEKIDYNPGNVETPRVIRELIFHLFSCL